MRPHVARLAPVAALALLAACGELAERTAPVTTGLRRETALGSASTLLVCPNEVASTTGQGLVDVVGGAVNGSRGSSMRAPAGAVAALQEFEIVTPASQYMEIQFNAVGVGHYTFAAPVTVTINYSRCPDSAIPAGATLHAVYIDPDTKQILEDMGGTVDPVARTVTFTTGHFSSYAVAY